MSDDRGWSKVNIWVKMEFAVEIRWQIHSTYHAVAHPLGACSPTECFPILYLLPPIAGEEVFEKQAQCE